MPKATYAEWREVEKLFDAVMMVRAQLRICRGLPSINDGLSEMLAAALRETDAPVESLKAVLRELGRL